MEPNPLLSILVDNDSKNCFKLMDELSVKFKMLNVDANEFAFLKTIILFKSDTKGLKDSHLVENIHEQAQFMLSQYINQRQQKMNQQKQLSRFGKLILSLPLIKNLCSSNQIQKFYFPNLINNDSFSVEKLFNDLIK